MSTEFRMTAGWERNIDSRTVRDGLDPLGADIVADAERYVPVDSGELKESLGYEVVDTAEGQLGVALYVYATAKHAAHVEMGTYKMAPQPYLRPAVEKNRGGL